MFDLFRSRDKAVRYLLGAVLALVAVSMVVTLIPGYGSGSVPDQVVAEIGDDVVSVQDVQLQVQIAMRNRSLPPEMVAVFVPQLVNQMIGERAIAYYAERMGFEIPESDVAQAIRSMLPNVFEGGAPNIAAYQEFLSRQNLTIPQFESNVRKNLFLLKLQNLVLEGLVVTPADVEAEFRRKNEKVKLDYIEFAPDKFKNQVKVTPEEIQNYYNQNKASFQTTAKRSIDLVVVDEAKVAESLTFTEAELRSAYESAKDRYRTPDRVKVRHILIKTEGKSKDEVSKLEAKAADLLKQIKGGSDFAELAKKNSDDPGSASKGGEMDWIVRGQSVKIFEDAAFTLKPKEVSSVVKTEYGHHILQVLDKESARLKPFEEVRKDLADEHRKQEVVRKTQSLADTARQEVIKAPDQARQVAARHNVIFHHIEKIAPGDPLQEIGVNAELESTLAGLPKGGVTQTVLTTGNKLAFAVVTDVFPARQAELEDVAAQVRNRITDDKARQVAQQKAVEAGEKLKHPGVELKEVAKSYGLEVKSPPEFDRTGAIEGIGPANLVLDAFNRDAGAIVGPIHSSDRSFISRVASKTAADMSKLAAERDGLVAQLKGKKARDRRDLFEDGLVSRLIKDGKIKINQEAIKRLTGNYRG